mmetsp:Transcript_62115/g.166683  ORF Transcript_62115/g.166683 Transcript_62115/m.166683 type:complete len:206 (-) Transcript_62115:105-722(-)
MISRTSAKLLKSWLVGDGVLKASSAAKGSMARGGLREGKSLMEGWLWRDGLVKMNTPPTTPIRAAQHHEKLAPGALLKSWMWSNGVQRFGSSTSRSRARGKLSVGSNWLFSEGIARLPAAMNPTAAARQGATKEAMAMSWISSVLYYSPVKLARKVGGYVLSTATAFGMVCGAYQLGKALESNPRPARLVRRSSVDRARFVLKHV